MLRNDVEGLIDFLSFDEMNETYKIIISRQSANNFKIPLEEKIFVCKSYLQTFYCKVSLGCGYSSRNKGKLTRHEKTCSSETKFKYVQKRYKSFSNCM